MKKFTYYFILTLLASTMLGLVGCDEEEYFEVTTTTSTTTSSTSTRDSTSTESSATIPTVKFSMSIGWPYVSEGEVFTVSEFVIDEENSSTGVTLNSVSYYLDDVLIAMSDTSPYALNYTITNESVGEHTLKIVADCDYDGLEELTYTYRLSIYVLEEPFALSFNLVLDNGDELSNGDTLSGYVELSEDNTIEGTILQMSYYWDDVLFAATAIDPFRFSYLIEDEEDGEHILSSVASIETEYGTFTVILYTYIVVNSDLADDSTLAPMTCVSSEQVGHIQVDVNGVAQSETEFTEAVYYN